MAEAIARLASIWIVDGGRSPLLLHEPRLAALTLRAIRIVLTLAVKESRTILVDDIASRCVTIADAASTNVDVLDGVEVTPCHRGILSFLGDQMAKRGLWFEQS